MSYNIVCEKCGSTNITFYRQMRVDHVWVVTARCEKMHIPNMRKIFYPVAEFKLGKLPDLPKDKQPERQLTMLEQIEQEAREQYPIKQPYKNFPFPSEQK